MAHYWLLRIWRSLLEQAANVPPKPGKEESPFPSELPKSAAEWASYNPSPAYDEAKLRNITQHPLVVSLQSYVPLLKGISMEAFFYYLLFLVRQLEQRGYYVHCFPVLAFMRLLANTFSPRAVTYPIFAQLNYMQHNVCQKLQMAEQAQMWIEQADGISHFIR